MSHFAHTPCLICTPCMTCLICTPTRTPTRQSAWHTLTSGDTLTSGGLFLFVHLFTTTLPPHPSLLRLSLVCVCVCVCARVVPACVFVWVHVCARTCMHVGVYGERAGFREMLSKRASLDPGWNEAQQQEAENMAKLAHRSKLACIVICIAMCIAMHSECTHLHAPCDLIHLHATCSFPPLHPPSFRAPRLSLSSLAVSHSCLPYTSSSLHLVP